ncbi:MAG: YebC/PmpR family DNA-binding transcriptional regulator [Clostridia bacterium]|nr:YebC/PmpR family DNA-binding transcriptional regulator [Clostridia bacterium]
MSGHSKWNNIKHKKEKTDAQKAKVFTKIGKEISIAVREGGSDPVVNGKLRDLIAKAKSLNVPNDNIKRIIEKAGADGVVYEEFTYEGYGPAGVAVIVTTATDKKNRTAGNIRHYFDKYNGNLGSQGCVSFMFSDKGLIIIDNEEAGLDEDTVMEAALECGAADFLVDGDIFEIYTEPEDLDAVKEALAEKYELASAELTKVPSSYITLENEEDIENMEKLLEALDDDDDVQDVYHNWESND